MKIIDLCLISILLFMVATYLLYKKRDFFSTFISLALFSLSFNFVMMILALTWAKQWSFVILIISLIMQLMIITIFSIGGIMKRSRKI
ncbi:MAG: hypothetical protein HQK49_20825 [Oligoflexia bacterium]|nr:hypothetical protein [Oligoflexia bacterium]